MKRKKKERHIFTGKSIKTINITRTQFDGKIKINVDVKLLDGI